MSRPSLQADRLKKDHKMRNTGVHHKTHIVKRKSFAQHLNISQNREDLPNYSSIICLNDHLQFMVNQDMHHVTCEICGDRNVSPLTT